jgi:hypothetical protein
MKNITLSAPEPLIEEARKQAISRGRTLNSEFREWLKSQAISGEERSIRYQQLMSRLSHVNSGGKFTREEMNER